MLRIFSIPQCWMTSQESMSGIFTDQGRVAEYEQQWHSIIFSPCLKKLRAEVSDTCSFLKRGDICSRYPDYVYYCICLNSIVVSFPDSPNSIVKKAWK